MALKINRNPIITPFTIVLLLLFMATLNVINRYYYFVYIAFFLLCIGVNGVLKINMSAVVPLCLLAVSWVIFSTDSLTASAFNLVKPFSYALCYIMGYNLIGSGEQTGKKVYRQFYLAVCVLAAGAFVHYVLNWITNPTVENRNTVDIWTNAAVAATGQAALACMPLGISLAMIFSRNGWKVKAGAFAVLLLVVGYNLVLSGRTIFVLIIVVGITAFLHQYRKENNKRFGALVRILLIIAVIVLIYQIDLFGIKTYIEQSPFYDRFFGEKGQDLDEDGRMGKKLFHLQNMLQNLFGGAHSREHRGFAHDLYLDTYDEAGVFAFLGLLIYIIRSIVTAVKCVTSENLPFALRQTVFCLILILNIEFWVEPILQGMPWLFASYCLIDGCISRLMQDAQITIGEHYENR